MQFFKTFGDKIKNGRFSIFTDSGMLCIWNYDDFKHVIDYGTWENELWEDADILKHIESGKFVPISLGDAAFDLEVRFDPKELSSRENKYLLIASKEYLLKSTGTVCISPIETVNSTIGKRTKKYKLKSGDYKVIINLIDWNQEPGALDKNGKITKNALPDLIVYILPVNDQKIEFRKSIETFRKEDSLR